MVEGGGLENRYPEQSGSWVRIPPSPPIPPIRSFQNPQDGDHGRQIYDLQSIMDNFKIMLHFYGDA